MSKKTTLTLVVTIIIGLFFSFLVSYSLYKSEKKAVVYEMQKDIDGAASSFVRELNVTTDLLYVMQYQVLASKNLEEKLFTHVSSKITERLPYVDSINWLAAVESKDKAGFEDKMSKLYQGFTLKPKTLSQQSITDSHYFPITYTSKNEIDPKLQGVDLLSIPSIKNEIQMSWSQGVPMAIFNTQLQGSLMSEQSFFILFPIFSGTANTKSARIKQIRGVFLVSLDIAAMFESVLGKTAREPIKLLLQKYNEEEVSVLLENVKGVSGNLIKTMSYHSKPFFYGGKEWQISGIPSRGYFSARMTKFPYVIFIFGSSIFIFIAYLVNILQSRALNIQERIAEKTRELREINYQLEKASRSDGLTSLFNRPYFDECLDAEVKRAQRDDLPISLIIVEIDNFKEYERLNGRNAADNVLRLISLALTDVLKRPSDLIARYADDAFAAILPSTKNGSSIAAECNETVKRLKIPFAVGKGEKYVSVSIGGVATFEADKINAEKLKSFAQVALSKAIAQGRDRVQWIFSPETA